ncbi:MAG: pseudouridine synthase [Proteobacteria bacterium]|nr:pseudouridine synthase [Pseudomonadota bacterium]
MHCTDRRGPQEVLIVVNKPYRVLCQFTDPDGRATLADYVKVPGVYPAGRLDFDSEGLLLLTDDGRLQAKISQPESGIMKRYWAQVEGTLTDDQIGALLNGVELKDGMAKAVTAKNIDAPAELWERDPPIRHRKNVADNWIEITLSEGRNRQVRHMTAAVGLPTLRLIRYSVGPWALDGLLPGKSREMSTKDAWNALLLVNA